MHIGFFLLLANLALLYWQWLCDSEVVTSTNSGFKGLKVSLKFVPYVTLCTEPQSRERMHFAHLKVANGEIWIVSNVRCVHRCGWGWGGERKRNLHCKLYAAKTGNQPTRATILDTIIYPLNKRYQIIGGNLKSLIQMKTKNGVFFILGPLSQLQYCVLLMIYNLHT